MDTLEVLRSLNDVDGVVGAFVGSLEGEVLASSLPSFIGQADLGAAITRLARIFQCSNEAGVDADAAQLRFDDYKLFTNRYDWGVLCVLAEARTSPRILRMATKVAARHLPRALKLVPESELEPFTAWHNDPRRQNALSGEHVLERPSSPEGFPAAAPPPQSGPAPSAPFTATQAAGGMPPEALTARRTRAELGRTIIYRGKRYDL